MVQVGGHLLICNICNNFSGHGFYQFSPELFFRALSEERGFKVEWIALAEYGGGVQWYHVSDPETAGQRNLLSNLKPTYIFVLAKKIEDKDLSNIPIQQSDYVSNWAGDDSASRSHGKFNRILPLALRLILRSLFAPLRRPYFEKVLANELGEAK